MRYGQFLTIQAVLKNFKDKFLLEKLIKGVTRDVDADAEAEAMNVESSLREKGIEVLFASKSSKSFAPPSASASIMADMAKMESFLDNADYQPQTHISDCEFFGFNPEYPRFPSNSPIFQFKSWQVTAMRQMIRILGNPNVKACLLADATGLEARPIQSQARAKTHTDEDDQELEPNENLFVIPDLPICSPLAKPILLIVLPELIEQWATEIKGLSEDFRVLIYHGDERACNFGSHEKISARSTKGKLTQDRPIFNGDEQTSRVVVITSVVTLRSRHGPAALEGNPIGWSI
ncbi:hypothetical protein BCON_0099g00160 [Botryotinia convoluta]|uniref:SNF2 N-terminal domain-containing protein n=1 Tax=Botryotinia convoluta TaxID=54673 RepID=A0A4Z1I698_9HELO|nr:hypothetical protein BCON_0099g00160 [Botryotinia convoluta]